MTNEHFFTLALFVSIFGKYCIIDLTSSQTRKFSTSLELKPINRFIYIYILNLNSIRFLTFYVERSRF